ncbi:MAG: hypothetical protein V8T86_11980 [Victivallis sp.]
MNVNAAARIEPGVRRGVRHDVVVHQHAAGSELDEDAGADVAEQHVPGDPRPVVAVVEPDAVRAVEADQVALDQRLVRLMELDPGPLLPVALVRGQRQGVVALDGIPDDPDAPAAPPGDAAEPVVDDKIAGDQMPAALAQQLLILRERARNQVRPPIFAADVEPDRLGVANHVVADDPVVAAAGRNHAELRKRRLVRAVFKHEPLRG